MLVMDAENAFNSINRTALLWNIRILWPRASRFVFNTYRGWSPLIIKGHDVGLYSSEGVIQGDPLSMFLYALATLPLINQLQSDPSITQLWFADDSSAVGCFSSILLWYENLCLIGPLFGYTPAPTKSHLVVKESMIDTASSLFANTGINIVTSCRFLGGVIGDQSGKMSFVSNKVDEWSRYVDLLSSVAEDQPQAAFIGFTKSLQQEWLYLQRVIADCEQQFHDLESTIKHKFIPSLIGHDCDDTDRLLFSLPINMGGLNIRIPTSSTTTVYNSLRAVTQILTDSTKNSISFSVTDHISLVTRTQYQYSRTRRDSDSQLLSDILDQCDPIHRRSLLMLRHQDSLSGWLTVLPVQKDNLNLTAAEFQDAFCLRYLKHRL